MSLPLSIIISYKQITISNNICTIKKDFNIRIQCFVKKMLAKCFVKSRFKKYLFFQKCSINSNCNFLKISFMLNTSFVQLTLHYYIWNLLKILFQLHLLKLNSEHEHISTHETCKFISFCTSKTPKIPHSQANEIIGKKTYNSLCNCRCKRK